MAGFLILPDYEKPTKKIYSSKLNYRIGGFNNASTILRQSEKRS